MQPKNESRPAGSGQRSIRRTSDDRCQVALERVALEAARFVRLENSTLTAAQLHHAALSAVHGICAAILRAEESGCIAEDIVDVLGPVREIHARSPFVSRLQAWPRGYPGDFETVEPICRGENTAPADSGVALQCEAYSLNFPIAQQHRNKVRHQAQQIARVLFDKKTKGRILAIACGGAPDFREVLPLLKRRRVEIHLNDADPAAIAFAKAKLDDIAGKCRWHEGNALELFRHWRRLPPFDLILAGGLFDYLKDRAATFLLHQAYGQLAEGGVLFFTNIAEGNPYRALISYVGNWFLIERSAEEILRLTDAAQIPRQAVSIRRDETGLAFLIEVRRGSYNAPP
ncbi:MAG TPA: class I SAM-dependent methyltransferase [Thermoanaerobaculia bacterium]|nr:class I SAM-dependent methyltransferase [Thermoanaerobaculia bacterium]